jgi:hypothetical protein
VRGTHQQTVGLRRHQYACGRALRAGVKHQRGDERGKGAAGERVRGALHLDRAAAEGAGQLQVQDKGIEQGGRVLQPADQVEGGDPGQPVEAPGGTEQQQEAQQQEMNRRRQRRISSGDYAILSMNSTQFNRTIKTSALLPLIYTKRMLLNNISINFSCAVLEAGRPSACKERIDG